MDSLRVSFRCVLPALVTAFFWFTAPWATEVGAAPLEQSGAAGGPNLTVTIADSPDPVNNVIFFDPDLKYTVTVTNNGNAPTTADFSSATGSPLVRLHFPDTVNVPTFTSAVFVPGSSGVTCTRVSTKADGEQAVDHVDAVCNRTTALGAGQSVTFELNLFLFFFACGTDAVTVSGVVDPLSVQTETDETDNRGTASTTAYCADLQLGQFTDDVGGEDLEAAGGYVSKAQYTLFNDGSLGIGAVTFSGAVLGTAARNSVTATVSGGNNTWVCQTTTTSWVCVGVLDADDSGLYGDNNAQGDGPDQVTVTVSVAGTGVGGNTIVYVPLAPACSGANSPCTTDVRSPGNADAATLVFATDTDTLLPLPTATATLSPTVTPTPTLTPTPTATDAATPTRTATPSNTLTATVTSTSVAGATNTNTPTRTATVTNTPLVSLTPTNTAATATPSNTRTATVTPTRSVTITPGGPSLPDLLLTTMSIEIETPVSCATGPTPLGVRVRFANFGGSAAGPFTVQVNGVQQPYPGLAVNEEGTLWFVGTAPGFDENVAIIDVLGQVAEANETNNDLSSLLPVPTPVPTCTASPTATSTATRTVTPVPSNTPSPTATAPATATPTSTVTVEATATRTATVTPTASATVTATLTVTTTRTPTPTPTQSTVSGHGFGLEAGTTPRATWRPGTLTKSLLIRWAAISNVFTFPAILDPGASSFTDTGSLNEATYCYVLLAFLGELSAPDVRGISDLFCYYPGTATGPSSGQPTGLTARLNESQTVELRWVAPGLGLQTRYELHALRFDGSAPRTIPINDPNQTSFSELVGSLTTCYRLVAFNGGTELGGTNTLCAAPGVSSFTAGFPDVASALRRLPTNGASIPTPSLPSRGSAR